MIKQLFNTCKYCKEKFPINHQQKTKKVCQNCNTSAKAHERRRKKLKKDNTCQ